MSGVIPRRYRGEGRLHPAYTKYGLRAFGRVRAQDTGTKTPQASNFTTEVAPLAVQQCAC